MAAMGSNLFPCPLCGAAARLGNYIVEAAIVCEGCDLTVTRKHAPTEDTGVAEVVAAWNRRSALTPATDAQRKSEGGR
jgi:hypothetical protein